MTISDNRMLTMSIPNVSGWSVYVDGEAVEIQNANIAFMGIYLEKGHHTIEIKYQPQTVLTGFIITVCAVIIYISLIIVERIIIKKQRIKRG